MVAIQGLLSYMIAPSRAFQALPDRIIGSVAEITARASQPGYRTVAGGLIAKQALDRCGVPSGFSVAVVGQRRATRAVRRAWRIGVGDGGDVRASHLWLVHTSLDLVHLAAIAWFEADYSVYTMRQASRRSWRIGQTQPVQVVFMAYRNTLQADALKLDVSRAGPTWWR